MYQPINSCLIRKKMTYKLTYTCSAENRMCSQQVIRVNISLFTGEFWHFLLIIMITSIRGSIHQGHEAFSEHSRGDQCALDKICCSLNGIQHCSARLPPPATPLLKEYWHQVPFYWLVHVNACDLHDVRCYRYLFVSINRPNLID